MTACQDVNCGPNSDTTTRVMAFVGAPNVGKSALFGELAEQYVDVSNYPGTTVETTTAVIKSITLIDTPGAYGISSFSEEERITREIILDADAVINVVDATQLDRDLFLTLQLLDMGIPTIVALNMMDEAKADGIDIDASSLETALGIPVVPTVAVTGSGVENLSSRLSEATVPPSTPITDHYDALPDDIEATQAEKTLLIEGDSPTAHRLDTGEVVTDGGEHSLADIERREQVYSERRTRVRTLIDRHNAAIDTERPARNRIGELLMRPLTGIPIALTLLGVIFYLIGVLVAQTFVGYAETVLFGQYYNPAVETAVGQLLPATRWADPIEFLLVNDNLGLLTITTQYIIGVLLPLVVAFHLVIGTLEDAGILPRLAVLTDRGLSRIGLNGRAVVPLIVGVGCVTMAVITTRIVGSRRERIISTALLGLAIPCSAQVGVIMGLLARLGFVWWVGYLFVLLTILGVVGVLLDRVLPGEQDALVEQLPRLRAPRPQNIARKSYNRTTAFLWEAGPLFGGTALVISTLDYIGFLEIIISVLQPLTAVLNLPTEFSRVLILGVIRRDFAAAGMTDMALSASQTFIGLVVITLFVPCILTMMMILKERDARSALLMWVGSWVAAFSVGGSIAVFFEVIT